MKKRIAYPGDFPLSKAVLHNEPYVMEISGLIGIDFATNQLQEGIQEQTKQIFENLKETLSEAGWDFSNIVKTKIYLKNMEDYGLMNEIYQSYFSKEYPARAAFAVTGLPANALIELECTATGDSID